MLYSKSKRLHVSAGSGHHQVFVFRHTEEYFIQLCGGLFGEEISTSRPFFEYDLSISGVWVSHSINLKVSSYNIKNRRKSKNQSYERQSKKTKTKTKKKESLVALSWGSRYVLSSCGSGLLRASSFIFMGRCVWKICV